MANHKKKNKYIIGLVVIVIFMIIIIYNSTLTNVNNEEINEMPETEQQIQDKEDENIKAMLMKLNERDRMDYYFGKFVDFIEMEDYESAYNLLYDEFKQNYFPTLKSFEEYIPTLFTEFCDIEFENIERNGNVYVLWINIADAINGKPGEKKQINVVIRENDYNDFEMSFSVI